MLAENTETGKKAWRFLQSRKVLSIRPCSSSRPPEFLEPVRWTRYSEGAHHPSSVSRARRWSPSTLPHIRICTHWPQMNCVSMELVHALASTRPLFCSLRPTNWAYLVNCRESLCNDLEFWPLKFAGNFVEIVLKSLLTSLGFFTQKLLFLNARQPWRWNGSNSSRQSMQHHNVISAWFVQHVQIWFLNVPRNLLVAACYSARNLRTASSRACSERHSAEERALSEDPVRSSCLLRAQHMAVG